MNIETATPISSEGHSAGKRTLKAAVVSVFLPIGVGLLSFVAQFTWHNYYWGIPLLGLGDQKTRIHTVSFDTVATPLWFSSAAVFLIVAFYTETLAAKRSCIWVIGTTIGILVGGLLLAMAFLGALFGGA